MTRFALIAAIVCWALVAAGQWQSVSDEPAHHPHAVAASIGDQAGVVIDHPHAGDGTDAHLPDSFASAVLPRAAGSLTTLALVAFILGCAVLCGCILLRATRGPPDRRASVHTGQSILIRFCIARR
ncbi:putative copper homeostasis (lipo)protein LpqS [Mycolicibacterium sp. XJ870]